MSSETVIHFACVVCNDTGLVRYDRSIGDRRNMPWTKACLCGHGDRYAGFMARVAEEPYRAAVARRKAA